jgi:hypothetical protein
VEKGRICSSREEQRVAFVRPKKVNGYEYYQVVRNYRDEDGKHQQEVLDHLGVHDSIEATIAFRRKKAESHLEQAKALSRRVEDFEADLQELYSDDRGGEIPSLEEALENYETWSHEQDSPDYVYYYGTGEFNLNVELLAISLGRAAKTIEYYELISHADQENASASHWQEKLNKLLDIQATYF